MQHVYETYETNRILHGEKSYRIEWNNTWKPIESSNVWSNFLEGLRVLHIILLDVSNIKVRDQNVDNYASLREEVDSEFE